MKKHPSASRATEPLLQFICAITFLVIGSFGAPASAQAQTPAQPDASQIARIEQYVSDVQSDPTADGVAKEEAARILASAKIMFEEAVAREENLKQYQYLSDNSEEIITDLTANAAMIQINDDDQERDDDPIALQNRLTLLMAERASLAETESTL